MTEEPVIVVTGGASGLGAALVGHFARAGSRVVMNCRNLEKAKGVLNEIEATGTAGEILPVRADVTRRDEVRAMYDRALEVFGQLDVLIHCAGVNRDRPFLEMTDSLWDEVVEAHLKSAFICCQEFVLHKPEGRGHIVTLGAACGLQGRKNGVNFCSAKGGVSALTKCMARELAPRIQVNCLIPSAVDTPDVRERYGLDDPARRKALVDGIPMDRVGALEDVTQMVEAILASRFTTGSTFFVNGGEFMQ